MNPIQKSSYIISYDDAKYFEKSVVTICVISSLILMATLPISLAIMLSCIGTAACCFGVQRRIDSAQIKAIRDYTKDGSPKHVMLDAGCNHR